MKRLPDDTSEKEHEHKQGLHVEVVCIEEKRWAPDDTYMVVPVIQVMDYAGFKVGDKVRVTVEKI